MESILLGSWPLGWSIALFIAGTALIAWVGPKLTHLADQLADRTGLGEAIVGAVFLGAVTSLSGITTTATAAASGDAELALSNAIGGIAAQTVFLAIADFFHRKGNLEHAAVSPGNLVQAPMLIGLLGLVLVGLAGPEWTWLGIHPVTPLLVLAYLGGTRIAYRAQHTPMWRPERTRHTQMEEAESGEKDEGKHYEHSLRWQFVLFAMNAALLAGGGWVVARSGISIADQTPLSSTIVGALFTAIATSLPELITAVAAVRQGALALAVGDIIGGNTFDVLFCSAGDIAYREGSIYHAAGSQQIVLIGLTIVMTSVLLMGLIGRQRQGPLGIGWESMTVLIVYGVGVALLWFL